MDAQEELTAYSDGIFRWQVRLGLLDWNFSICPKRMTPEEQAERARAAAYVWYHLKNRIAVFHLAASSDLCDALGIPVTADEIERMALHEVGEVLVAPLVVRMECSKKRRSS